MNPFHRRFRFRSFTAGDLDQVLKIENRAFSSPWTRDHFRGELARRKVGWNRILEQVCSEADRTSRVVGYACTWVVADEMQINNLAVDPAFVGKGLGRRLLDHLLEEARRRECVEVNLEVARSNRVARKMYESAGFFLGGSRPGYYEGRTEEALVLRCFLCSRPVRDL